MKRTLSFVLALILCLSLAAVPQMTGLAASGKAPAKITGLKITTAGKSKQLKLTWNQQSGVSGYQIYRSTTGKTGSYQKIATLRGAAKTGYTDTGLKTSKTYFYAVRAFGRADGKTVCGKFAKKNLSTRLTNAYVEKYIRKANDVYNDWLYARDGGGVDYNKTITLRHNSMEMEYCMIKNPKIKSMADVEKIVGQYFDPALLYDSYTYFQSYYEYDGHVYASAGGVGTTFLDFDSMKIKAATDKKTIVRVNYIDYMGDPDHPGEPAPFVRNVTLVYVKDHWRIQGEFYNAA